MSSQVRHPERVFLREGSPGSGTVPILSIGIKLSIQEILRAKRRAQDDVPGNLQNILIEPVRIEDRSGSIP